MAFKPDKGPFRTIVDSDPTTCNGRTVYVGSEDFHHDALMKVSGDFASLDDKVEYANDIAKRLNGNIPCPERVITFKTSDTKREYWIDDLMILETSLDEDPEVTEAVTNVLTFVARVLYMRLKRESL